MMIDIGMALAATLFATAPAEPGFTEAELTRLTACADGDAFAACSGLEAEAEVAAACLARPPEADRIEAKMCLFPPILACIEGARPADEAEARLATLVCGARARGGLQVALADWLTRKEATLPAEAARRMRDLLPEVRRQADAQSSASLAAGESDIKASGVRLGVWAGYGHHVRTEAARFD